MIDIICRCGHPKEAHGCFYKDWCTANWLENHEEYDEEDFKCDCITYQADNLLLIENLARARKLV